MDGPQISQGSEDDAWQCGGTFSMAIGRYDRARSVGAGRWVAGLRPGKEGRVGGRGEMKKIKKQTTEGVCVRSLLVAAPQLHLQLAEDVRESGEPVAHPDDRVVPGRVGGRVLSAI